MAAAAAAAAAASSCCLSLRFSTPLHPSPPLRRVLLPPALPPSASPRYQFSRAVVGSRGHRLCVRSMASEGNPQSVEVPRSVPVRVAQELHQAGHRYLDVRTLEEFGVGHAVGAVNVPYMFKVGSGMTKNPRFLEEVSLVFGKDDEIIVGCQSGKSDDHAINKSNLKSPEYNSNLKCLKGFTGITDVAGGYSAWIQNGLPSE